ncbi:MAG: hypothetical protein ABI318_09935 [Chthoniobacteraceae bacterium]
MGATLKRLATIPQNHPAALSESCADAVRFASGFGFSARMRSQILALSFAAGAGFSRLVADAARFSTENEDRQ